ncbi:MAG TPA: 2-oxo acid dehydrogenase subunit E2 [Candidatus Binatia bacterium]|jgi:pyruvate dehydrogenase E2 component (dihydrolipoamide acetyltransferase)
MDVRVPRLAEGVESATVANILVAPGDRIEKDQVILELETEKAVGPIPSPASGQVAKIHVKPGDEVNVGQALITLAQEGAVIEKAPAPEKKSPPAGEQKIRPAASPQLQKVPAGEPSGADQYRYQSAAGAPPPASPSVRKIARELGIDLNRVKGSERGGRITIADLKNYVEQLQHGTAPASAPEPAAKPAAPAIDFSRWGPVQKKPLSSIRRTIGQRMYESWSTIPHVTQLEDVDITHVGNLRKEYGPSLAKKDKHLTLTPFVLKAVVAALKKYPIFNSSLDESTGEVVFKNYFHIGVAVDTEAGLIVPVLRDVDKKNLADLAQELNELVERTRKRKVSLDELQGGSFTISNQGGIGGGHFTPIINKPEVAVLGIGRSALKPVVKDGKIEARAVLPIALSYDHRVMDGADAVRFITQLIATLENFPERELKG